MTDDEDKRERQILGRRQDRLKLALRENLKRRKSQARGRSDISKASSDDPDAFLHDAGRKEPDG